MLSRLSTLQPLESVQEKKEEITKVHVFTRAKYLQDDDSPKDVDLCNNEAINPVKVWRHLAEEMGEQWLVRPGSCVFTSKATKTTKDVKSVLAEVGADALDMETAAIFETLKRWNETFPQIYVKPALSIKAVSDAGSDADRDENIQQAIQNAAKVLFPYLDYLRNNVGTS